MLYPHRQPLFPFSFKRNQKKGLLIHGVLYLNLDAYDTHFFHLKNLKVNKILYILLWNGNILLVSQCSCCRYIISLKCTCINCLLLQSMLQFLTKPGADVIAVYLL